MPSQFPQFYTIGTTSIHKRIFFYKFYFCPHKFPSPSLYFENIYLCLSSRVNIKKTISLFLVSMVNINLHKNQSKHPEWAIIKPNITKAQLYLESCLRFSKIDIDNDNANDRLPSHRCLAQTPNNVWTIRVTLCHVFSIISQVTSQVMKLRKRKIGWVTTIQFSHI